MARGVNKVIIIGNLGQDPDVRTMANGNLVAGLSVATDESYKDKQTGQTVPKTEWHRVIFNQRMAEICRDYLKKGSKVYVEGRLITRKWQDQSGADRYTTEIRGRELQMLDPKDQAQQNNQQRPANNQQQGYGQQQPRHTNHQQAPVPQAAPMDDFDDSDIPF